jgi:predicted O-linked N-acetylglucosamine transferase (SPINDLY family)
MNVKKNKQARPVNKELLIVEWGGVYKTLATILSKKPYDPERILGFLLETIKTQNSPVGEPRIVGLFITINKKINQSEALKIGNALAKKMPESCLPWMNLAFIYEQYRDHKNAVEMARKALTFNPCPTSIVQLAAMLSKFNDDVAALSAIKDGFAQSDSAITLATSVLRVALKNCDWALSEEVIAKLRAYYNQADFVGVETPRTHLLWCADEALNVKVLSKFSAQNFPAQSSSYQYQPKDLKKQKMRIGLLSYDFREHATSHLAMGMLRHINRGRFEYYAYCTSWDDGSALRRDILNRCAKIRIISDQSDKEAADLICRDQIDVLVDFNGLTEGTRLGIFALRPAPVQMSYLGFPGTSGGRFMDYFFADDYSVPKEKTTLYPEKIIRIMPTYQINDYAAKWLPPALIKDKISRFQGKVLIGMFNNINKVSSVVWGTWMAILNKLPDALLWILNPGQVAINNLLQIAASHGIAKDRIIFAPKLKVEEHFARLQMCDFVLDPWPYGGHTTTSDALFCNVPVVALEGTNFPSRVSGGLLLAAGLPKLVAKDLPEYIEIAVALAEDKSMLLRMKEHLKSNKQQLPVFDAIKRTQQIERAFLFAYGRYLEKNPPVSFRVIE